MGMNPLDFLNSFLNPETENERYRKKRREMFLNNPNPAVRWHAENPTYEPAPMLREKYGPHQLVDIRWYHENPTYAQTPKPRETYRPEQLVDKRFLGEPEIPEYIALARSKPNYNKWLASSKNFTLGDKQYRWEETPVGNIPEKLLSIPQTKSRNYSNLLSTLTKQKRAITGNSRYIPVLVEPFK